MQEPGRWVEKRADACTASDQRSRLELAKYYRFEDSQVEMKRRRYLMLEQRNSAFQHCDAMYLKTCMKYRFAKGRFWCWRVTKIDL